ncbi:MAG: LruC domain-containing protein [Alistipes sp.]|nr:LruC domain-containing protein [Alistipes sp.]
MKSYSFFIAFACILGFTSCLKNETSSPTPVDPAPGFNWSPIESKAITVAEESDILNAQGDTVATNIAAGNYTLPVEAQTSLVSQPSIGAKGASKDGVTVFPSSQQYATIMCEDLFPYKGDYDMNDIVVDARITCNYNAGQQTLKTINIRLRTRAVGSTERQIGFAAYLKGLSAVNVQDVKGANLTLQKGSDPEEQQLQPLFSIKTNNTGGGGKGTELNSNEAVVPLLGDLRSCFTTLETKSMINTFTNLSHNPGKEYNITIQLANKAVGINDFTIMGANPNAKVNLDLFAVVGQRDKEVHLKGQTPTQKFNRDYFKIQNLTDFVQADGYVWMVVAIGSKCPYAQEMVNIETAFPSFASWVQSAGKSYDDWYTNYVPDLVYTE